MMKLDMLTGGILLIMHIFFFSLSHENCGCYGNKYSQNIVPVGDLCVASNTCALLNLDQSE